jgi:uncharacterized phage-associated protein
MLINHHREKLLQVIIYFAHHTQELGKIKLFKLLYLLDFEHFRQTGRSVTGLQYRAWKFGPVPAEVAEEWDELSDDFASVITIQPELVVNHLRQKVVAKVAFDNQHFTKRELRLMADIAQQYQHVLSQKMIDVTHAENGAWAKVWNEGRGQDQTIPYDLAIEADHPHRDAILESARHYQAMLQHAA